MKTTTLFLNGASQALRVPKEMRFEGERVLIEKVAGVTIILEESNPWAGLRLARALAAVTGFMSEGRDVLPIAERPHLDAAFTKSSEPPTPEISKAEIKGTTARKHERLDKVVSPKKKSARIAK